VNNRTCQTPKTFVEIAPSIRRVIKRGCTGHQCTGRFCNKQQKKANNDSSALGVILIVNLRNVDANFVTQTKNAAWIGGSSLEVTLVATRISHMSGKFLAIGILVIFTTGSAYWVSRHPVVEKSLFIVGVALAGFGAAGRAWAISYVNSRSKKRLVTAGPYSLCRNPVYFFSLILGIGFGFCTETFTIPAFIATILGIAFYFQIRSEENKLLTAFGREYEAYLATIPRFVPSYRNFSEPDEMRISPRLLSKGLFGIALALVLIGALELLEGLHRSGALPSLFKIY
jgi:protein-S-isoprenylcysteine O-methyltransferase Ste14